MRKWAFIGALAIGLVMLGMHLGVTAALYYATAEVKVRVADTDTLVRHLVGALSSEDVRQQLKKAWEPALEELAEELKPRMEQLGRELQKAFEGSLSPVTQPSAESSSAAGAQGQSATAPYGLDLEDLNQERLRTLLKNAVREGSLSKLEWHPAERPTIRTAGKKLATAQVGEPIVLDMGSLAVSRRVHALMGELPWVTAKRVYGWPSWLVVYLVAGCVLISFGTGAVSVAVLRRSTAPAN
jgi:hypothetical protein